jgi:hypothetical protein
VEETEVARWGTTMVLGVAAIGLELRTKHIPNWLTLGALLPLLVVAAWFDRLQDSVLGFFLAGGVGIWLFQRQALAGGGVKTAAMLGAGAGAVGGVFMAATFLIIWAVGEIYARMRSAPALEKSYPSTPVAYAAVIAGLAARAFFLRGT